MNNIQMINAYKALDKLVDLPMRPSNSYRIMKLVKKLKPLCDSYNEAEMKLIHDLGLENNIDGRRIIFDNDDQAEAYSKAHIELDSMESGVDESWRITLGPEENLEISPRDMMLMYDLVSFFDEGETDE